MLLLGVGKDLSVNAFLHLPHEAGRVQLACLIELLITFADDFLKTRTLLTIIEISAEDVSYLTHYLVVCGDDDLLA